MITAALIKKSELKTLKKIEVSIERKGECILRVGMGHDDKEVSSGNLQDPFFDFRITGEDGRSFSKAGNLYRFYALKPSQVKEHLGSELDDFRRSYPDLEITDAEQKRVISQFCREIKDAGLFIPEAQMRYEVTRGFDYSPAIWIEPTRIGGLTFTEAKKEALKALKWELESEQTLLKRINQRDPDLSAEELRDLMEYRQGYMDCIEALRKNISDVRSMTKRDLGQ